VTRAKSRFRDLLLPRGDEWRFLLLHLLPATWGAIKSVGRLRTPHEVKRQRTARTPKRKRTSGSPQVLECVQSSAAFAGAARLDRQFQPRSATGQLLAFGSLAVLLLGSAVLPAATNPISADEIPPLRAPRAELPPDFWEQYGSLVIVGCVLSLMAIAGVVWLLSRPKPPVLVPPAARARRELELLRQQPEDGALLSRVSQIVRHYISARFGLPPGELTTTEFCRVLAGAEQVGPDLSSAVGEFLRQCDWRKFAPAPPSLPLGVVPRAFQLIETAQAWQAELRRQREMQQTTPIAKAIILP